MRVGLGWLSLMTLFSLSGNFDLSASEDSLQLQELAPVLIVAPLNKQSITWLQPISKTYIHSGKKSEVIDIQNGNMALSERYGRQIFAKVPGVFVYDMDGTGNQMNISARGLDAHRGWEFNIRKDGIMTNSDIYGYPASHYNIPLEAVERIELIRGTASLQYGAQFGGMLNFIGKRVSAERKIQAESINSVGSYGLFSTFNRLSGRVGKWQYNAWIHRKKLDGYRENNRSESGAELISIQYDVNDNLRIKAEWTHSRYLLQLAGPLTDSMFKANPRLSTRFRSFYSPDIHVPSFSLEWQPNSKTFVQFTSSSVLGLRNSVLYDRPANIADTISAITLEYNPRQVDIDRFRSFSNEWRVRHDYYLFCRGSTIAAGIQVMTNRMYRRQQGKGTTGTNYTLELSQPGWGRELYFNTDNLAIFAENSWQPISKLTVGFGFRTEIGTSRLTGQTVYLADTALKNVIRHQYPLFGANFQFDITKNVHWYGGLSQAYRPVILKDIVPQSNFEVTDKNLKDAKGVNAETGLRGVWKFLTWDVTSFYINYRNRLGTLALNDENGNLLVYRTNIGHSRTLGLEVFVQGQIPLTEKSVFTVFTSTSFMDARYYNAVIRTGNTNTDISGNKVESTPAWISRNGASLRYEGLDISVLYSHTASNFADALNAVEPSANGATGMVPAYGVADINLSYRINKYLRVQFNVNNLFNENYFTKRPQFYPGPGIWPSDGRTFSGTIAINL